MIVMTAGLSLGCAGTAAVAANVAPSSTVSQSASPPVAATSAPATGALTVGAPLSAALEHLRAAGLQLVYSSALVAPDLRVKSDPGSGPAAELAARLLAPHGLALDLVGPGVYVVVRATVLALPGASASSAAPAVREAPADAPLEQVSVYASRYRVDPAQGLALVDELVGSGALEGYPLLPSVRADLLLKLGRAEEAKVELGRAIQLTDNARTRALLERRLAGLP